jgi:hypothetical protein
MENTQTGNTQNTSAANIAALQAKFSEYDFIMVIDKSGSMGDDVGGNGPNAKRSRWEHMQETATQFSREISKIDSDGIGVVVFSGSGVNSYDGVNADKVKEIFANNRPGGSTPLHSALEEALKLAGKSAKKDFIVVFTDGQPDDEEAVAKLIIKQANSQKNDEDLTFLFVQVGNDPSATSYLNRLDDGLQKRGAKFDIVDSKTIDEVDKFPSIIELIAHAVND